MNIAGRSRIDEPNDVSEMRRGNRSDYEYIQKDVKHKNLVHLWVEEIDLDKYLMKHQYGLVKARKEALPTGEDLTMTMMPGMEKERDVTYMNEKRIMKQDIKKVGKIGPIKTFFALLKGYCAIVILIIPKAFQNGGYLFSAITLLISCMLTTICTLKLVEAGLVTRFLNYSRITKTALGENAKRLLDVMLMLT